MRATYIANKFTKILLCAAALLAVATSCRHGATAGAPQGDSADLQTFDLTDIENAGELIAVTLSGPETYYTYRGQEMGLQYLLAEHFTKSLGLGLRMEIAHDTTELVNMLLQAKADLIACPLPRKTIEKLRLIPAAPQGKGRKAWAVRPTSPRNPANVRDRHCLSSQKRSATASGHFCVCSSSKDRIVMAKNPHFPMPRRSPAYFPRWIGPHHHSLSRYHCTVLRMPVSNVSRGFQPNSPISFDGSIA